MFDLNNSCMKFKVHLIHEYWNKDNCLGNMMNFVYKTFLVNTGLAREVFAGTTRSCTYWQRKAGYSTSGAYATSSKLK